MCLMIVFLERNANVFSFFQINQVPLVFCILCVFFTSLYDQVLIALQFSTICMMFKA